MTKKKHNQERYFESRYNALVSSHADLVSRYTPDCTLIFVTPSYCQFFGRTEEDLLGSSMLGTLIDDEQRKASRNRLDRISLQNPVIRTENMVHRADGEIRHVDWVTTGIFDVEGVLVEYQSVGRDITKYRQTQEELSQSRTYYKQAAKIAGIGYWIWDCIEQRLEFCTEEASSIYGVTVDESLQRVTSSDHTTSTKHPDDIEAYKRIVTEAFNNKTGFDTVYRIYRADGELRYVRQLGEPIFDQDGNTIKTIGTLQDITDQKLAEIELNNSRMYYKQAAQIAGVGYWIWDEVEDCLSFCTEEAAAIHGVSQEEALARSSSLSGNLNTTHPDDMKHYEDTLISAVNNKTGFDVTYRMYRADGELRYVRQLGEPILDQNGNLIQTIGTIQDITEQKLAEEELAHMARHDILTGVPNRALFLDRLSTELKAALREKRQLSVLFVDLDGFKAVNDNAGHHAGDQLLIQLAKRLKTCVREMDTIGRIGGDEFSIVLGGDVTKEHVTLVAEKILSAISKPYQIDGGEYKISASIGIALYPQDGDTPEGLLAVADEAMYAVKRSSKNAFRFSKET